MLAPDRFASAEAAGEIRHMGFSKVLGTLDLQKLDVLSQIVASTLAMAHPAESTALFEREIPQLRALASELGTLGRTSPEMLTKSAVEEIQDMAEKMKLYVGN